MKKASIFDCGIADFHLNYVNYCSAKVGHFHPGIRVHSELVYKIDGCSDQIFDDIVIRLVPDSVYFIPAYTENTFTVIEPGTIIIVSFDLSGEAAGMKFTPELIALEPGNRYKSQFLRAYEAWQKKDAARYLRAHALVSEIFADLIHDRERQYMQSSKYALIAPALSYIREHYRDPISIRELTALCGISDEYLRTLFRSYTGQTPHAYINTLRLENAREMLQSGFASVAEAAEKSGFESPGYFSRLFKKRYNISPGRVNDTKIDLPSIFEENDES